MKTYACSCGGKTTSLKLRCKMSDPSLVLFPPPYILAEELNVKNFHSANILKRVSHCINKSHKSTSSSKALPPRRTLYYRS